MKIAYIMRGVPGSGKTPRATELAGAHGKVHSTSDYFVVDGEYRFNPKEQARNHADNYDAFVESLAFGVTPVICDNTNVRHREYTCYVQVAQDYGYDVKIVVMPHPDPEIASTLGAHHVPASQIERMIKNWEN